MASLPTNKEVLTTDECYKLVKNSSLSSRQDVQSDEHLDTAKMVTVIESVDVAIMHLFDKSEELERKVNELKESLHKKPKDFDKLHGSLLIGQLASKLDKEIVKFLLKGTGVKAPDYLTINKLEYATDNPQSRLAQRLFESQEQIKMVLNNWDCLDQSVDSDMLDAIEGFKNSHDDIAHPDASTCDVLKYLTFGDHDLPENRMAMVRKMTTALEFFEIGTF